MHAREWGFPNRAGSCAAVRLFAEARAAAAKVQRRAVAKRLALQAAAAAARVPLYGTDTRRAVTVLHPVHACHAVNEAFGAGPFAAAPFLLEAVKTPTRRARDMSDLIETFMFAIPKARAPPPVLTCSAPSARGRGKGGKGGRRGGGAGKKPFTIHRSPFTVHSSFCIYVLVDFGGARLKEAYTRGGWCIRSAVGGGCGGDEEMRENVVAE